MRIQHNPNPSSEQDMALESVLNRLQSGNKVEAEEAAASLETMDAEQLLRIGQAEASRYRRVQVRTGWLIALSLLVGFILLSWQPFAIFSKKLDIFVGYAVIIVGVQIANRYRRQISASRQILSQHYSKVSDKWMAPLGLLVLRDRSVNNPMLIEMLLRSLPVLTHSDVQTWSAEQKAALLVVLEPPLRSYQLALAALKALEQVGDESALPAVQKLANMQRETPLLHEDVLKLFRPSLNALAMQVKQEAQQCLPYLTDRANEQQQAKTLLRGAAATDAPTSDILLRPASPEADSLPAEQLLRPS